MSEEKPHHPYSPSTLQFLEACPCWRSKSETNARAVAGTLAHRSVETGIDDSKLSDDDALAVAECRDFYEQRKQLICGSIIELKEPYLPIDDCEFSDAKGTTAGYVDAVLVNENLTYAEIFDWKFGRWPVETAQNNLQGIAYTLGVLKAYPRVQKVIFWFKQPIINVISQAIFERSQVPELYLRLQTVVARAREARQANDFSTARPVVPACNFCSAIGRCPKVLEVACKIGSKFHPLEIPENLTPTMALDPKAAALAMRLAAVMTIWSDAFRRQTTDRVLRGDAELPEGYAVQSKTDRSIIDVDAYRRVTLQYLTAEEFQATLTPTFGSVEDLIEAKASRGQKTAMIRQFRQQLEDSGAVEKSLPYSFLRAVTKNEEKNK